MWIMMKFCIRIEVHDVGYSFMQRHFLTIGSTFIGGAMVKFSTFPMT